MIVNADCLDHLKTLPDNTVDCLVTDPPYGINFMGKAWDDFSKGQKNQKYYFEKTINEYGNKKNARVKALSGALEANCPIYNFEGMIEFFVPIWKECLRVMKPGAFGYIFCIPRQDCLSRMMMSLEQAGFNINFSSIYWTYASGFPKALNIGKAIDKRAGKEREVIGKNPRIATSYTKGESHLANILKDSETAGQITAPATPEAKKLEGSYGGFQPKPAVEVIIVVMKPLSKNTYIDQALDNGKGVVWLDDCRIPYKDENLNNRDIRINNKPFFGEDETKVDNGIVKEYNSIGRFPANLLVQDDVLDDGKITKGKSKPKKKYESPKPMSDGFLTGYRVISNSFYYDGGSFSRYFSLDAWAEKNLPFLIVPKASKSEKNRGCNKLPQKPGTSTEDGHHCGIEETPYQKNHHPTVKPIKVMSYLITMGSREGDVILDPFAGSGTTGCAAILLRRKYILIEMDKDYIEIIKARVKYYIDFMQTEPLKF